MKAFNVGLIGLGNVGSRVWHNLLTHKKLLAEKSGKIIEIKRVALRSLQKGYNLGIPKEILTTDWQDIVNDPEIEAVVELIGGIDISYEIITSALKKGKDVVTANKALLANHGQQIANLAFEQKRRILFEASVAGGIPLLQAIQDGLVANRFLMIAGIVNGTCNYILTEMTSQKSSYAEALKKAKELGYAEANEKLDVSGEDSAHKAAILCALSYRFWPKVEEIYTAGIESVDPMDIQYAADLGYVLKLLAIIKKHPHSKKVEIRVHPTLLKKDHILSSVSGAFNAVIVKGDIVGDQLFYGRGAGGDPTASAVLSDLVELARYPSDAYHARIFFSSTESEYKIMPISEIISRYYVRLNVVDKPGVLASIAQILGRKNIGISSVVQPEVSNLSQGVPLIIMVHDAKEKDFTEACAEMSKLPFLKGNPVIYRVEDFHAQSE
ncbi:homoserine dehydrogenase [Methylacidiphilum kamchatkense Kam1]|uniref:Homoserine dehydrogenase n=1 Tax=Methylacidiphilum kamchatkense Kam1 TaxID=1202785 RepID=A0A0C1UU23_9BACT|nr:homoserine dehydrogenase [Methylacidiphilum kamchatkense]KIE59263.1 homoserine dehydrogenase [Methylacidiphilum kamchatkense Kam1]QDQ42778.1 homoserine dehydrogenase [Methylacidiphilum kamchatkense Kam1]